MQFNFAKTEEVGVTRTRAKRVTINKDSINYELENRIVMKDGTDKFYNLGNLKVDTTEVKDISNVDIDTGAVDSESVALADVMLDMNTKVKAILKKYTYKDFEPKTESGTSYFEVKDIYVDNDFNIVPSVTFNFNEVVVLANGNEMRLPQDSLYISMQMDITKTEVVRLFLSLNQTLFNILYNKASILTPEEVSNLV